jgi:Fe-S cluster biosynthesis and repair protein YggX
MDMEKRLKENLKYSERLCEILNKDCAEPVKYTPVCSNCDIGVKQLLDETGLHYNELFLKDEIKDSCKLDEVINIIYVSLATGRFNYVYPTEKAKRIYNQLKANEWDIYLDDGELYIDEGINVEDILKYEIRSDYIKFEVDKEFYGYKAMVITKDNENDFNIEYIV